jgi:hypothetical protein
MVDVGTFEFQGVVDWTDYFAGSAVDAEGLVRAYFLFGFRNVEGTCDWTDVQTVCTAGRTFLHVDVDLSAKDFSYVHHTRKLDFTDCTARTVFFVDFDLDFS